MELGSPKPPATPVAVATAELSVAELRSARYDALFAGELPQIPPEEDAHLSMSALARATHRSGSRTIELQDHLAHLPTTIATILDEHEASAHAGDEALFSFIDQDSREAVEGVVNTVFTQWEVTRARNGQEPLVTNAESSVKWFVLETAAAVMEVSGPRQSFNITRSAGDAKNLAKVLAVRGPRFITQWFDGTIMTEWMNEQSITPEEQAETRKLFTTAMLKRIAVHNISDPLGALERTRTHLQETLTDENIALYLGWSTADAHKLFPSKVRKCLAVSNMADPLKACRAWVRGELSIEPRTDHTKDNRLQALGLL